MALIPYIWIGFSLIWAGVCLAGNLVAAPAKFQVKHLDRATALRVGRAQFQWVGYVEWGLLGLIILGMGQYEGRMFLFMSLPMFLFACQKIVLTPRLQAHTNRVLEDEDTPRSTLHRVFIICEVIKFMALLLIPTHALLNLIHN